MDRICILFEEFLETVPAGFAVIPIVQLSHDNYSYQEYANYVVKILEEKGLPDNPISTVAGSFGGRIAYELLSNPACNTKYRESFLYSS